MSVETAASIMSDVFSTAGGIAVMGVIGKRMIGAMSRVGNATNRVVEKIAGIPDTYAYEPDRSRGATVVRWREPREPLGVAEVRVASTRIYNGKLICTPSDVLRVDFDLLLLAATRGYVTLEVDDSDLRSHEVSDAINRSKPSWSTDSTVVMPNRWVDRH